MTIEHELNPKKRFAAAVLPWLLAGVFLLVYVLTLNHWASLANVSQVARASGWEWRPQVYHPLSWLTALAFHWLPAANIPLALNLFGAVCAAAAIGLLARSVALLPHDRTEEQRARERSAFGVLSVGPAWLPPLFAAVLCGLQLTFWTDATTASEDMLDLLLFAYVVRCLLEYRIEERDSWLFRASAVFGLAMTNDWAMVAFLPLYLLALVWNKGLAFFNTRFLARVALCGGAGLLLYLLLPLVQGLSGPTGLTFWQTLKLNLAEQKGMLFLFPFSKDHLLHGFNGDPLWVLGLSSLLPLLLLAVCWPSYFGDPSKLGVALTTLLFHVFHAFMLFFCIWVAFDSKLSPRVRFAGLPFPLLSFYFLGALSTGYLTGYFLLVFRPRQGPGGRPRPSPAWLPWANGLATGVVWALVLVAPSVLLYRNLDLVRLQNGPVFSDFADAQVQALPNRETVVLADDPAALWLAEAAAVRTGSSGRMMFVDTSSLPYPDYHAFLKRQYRQRWPVQPPKNRLRLIEDTEMLDTMLRLVRTNDVFYLHPSFGYYFEYLRQAPHGLVYQLKFYPTNSFFAPLADAQLIRENEDFWSGAEETALKPLLAFTRSASAPREHGVAAAALEALIRRLRLPRQQSPEIRQLANDYSRALDNWGVQMQKAGRLREAGAHFATALELNPDNKPAQANQDCNAVLQAGKQPVIQDPKALQERFGKYRSWEPLMEENGPFDEPSFCYELAKSFVVGRNIRQATEYFARTVELAPADLPPDLAVVNLPVRLWLAECYDRVRMPDQALAVVHQLHSNSNLLALARLHPREFLVVEASADLDLQNPQAADAAVQAALRQAPDDPSLLFAATQVYVTSRYFSNALNTAQRLVSLFPTNSGAWVNEGFIYLQMQRYTDAIPVLDKALSIETNASDLHNSAVLDRAIAYLRSLQLDAAQQDYETLQRVSPADFRPYFGLAEIAYRRKDTNAAIRNCELYLTNAPAGTEEARFVAVRLKDLKAGQH